MTKTMPIGRTCLLVSVVIPTYNRATFLPAAINSVLNQTYPNIEIIVVDDGSTDHTQHVMEQYRGRVAYHRQANGGVASARNAGLALARGEFVAFMDSDDICMPQRVATQVACFQQLPDVVLCSSDFSAFNAERLIEASHIATCYGALAATPGRLRTLYSDRDELRADGIEWFRPKLQAPVVIYSGQVYEYLVWGNFIHPPTVMVRRAVAEAVGGFDENIPIATEYDWLIRVSRLGRMAYLDIPLLMYRYSGEQLTSPRHRAQISLDTIMTMGKVRRADATLFQRHQRRFQQRIGICYLNASDASVDSDKIRAVCQIWQSLLHAVFTFSSLKVIVKLLVPHVFLRCYRYFRSAIGVTSESRVL